MPKLGAQVLQDIAPRLNLIQCDDWATRDVCFAASFAVALDVVAGNDAAAC